MTVIAWDGKTLAADRMAQSGDDYQFEVTKIRKSRGHLIFGAGNFDSNVALFDWFDAGADPATYPLHIQNDNDRWAPLMVVKPDGTLWRYERACAMFKVDSPLWASGSGRAYALAGMEMGLDARAAVELAIKLCPTCGLGVDTLSLDSPIRDVAQY